MKADCVLCGQPTAFDAHRVPLACECPTACANCPRPVPLPVRHEACHRASMVPVEAERERQRRMELGI